MLCRALDADGPARLPRRPRRRLAVPGAAATRFDVPEEARERLLHELVDARLRRPRARGRARSASAPRPRELLVARAAAARRRRRARRRAGPVADAVEGLRDVLDAARRRTSPTRVIFDLGLVRAAAATTRAPCSRSTTRRSASRSAAAGATTTCSAASAARCPPSASRSASTALHVALAGEERGAVNALRPDHRRPARRAVRRDARRCSTALGVDTARGPRQRPQAALRGRRHRHDAPVATCRPTSRPAPPTSASPARTS